MPTTEVRIKQQKLTANLLDATREEVAEAIRKHSLITKTKDELDLLANHKLVPLFELKEPRTHPETQAIENFAYGYRIQSTKGSIYVCRSPKGGDEEWIVDDNKKVEVLEKQKAERIKKGWTKLKESSAFDIEAVHIRYDTNRVYDPKGPFAGQLLVPKE